MPKPKSKVKRIIPLATAMALCVLAYPAYATVYDLQPYTRCNSGVCNTTVDVTSLGLSAQKISNLKMVNITNFLTKTGIISNFSYFWSGNTVSITGSVSENVYWSFGAGTDRYDPWWNYTSVNASPTFTFPSSLAPFSSSVAYGHNVTFKANASACTVQKYSSDTSTRLRLMTPNKTTQLATVNYSGDYATITYPYLNGSTYVFFTDNSGSSRDVGYNTYTYPNNTNSWFNIVSGAMREGQSNDISDTFDNYEINCSSSTSVSVWYETGLFLNGTQANRSVIQGEKVNITSQTNLTGLNVTVYDNGALIGFNLTRYENTNNYSAGTHNITSAYYNASVNSTLTWWLTVVGINPVNTIACFKTRNVCVDTMTNRVFLRGNPL